jgi:hypothetical protein
VCKKKKKIEKTRNANFTSGRKRCDEITFSRRSHRRQSITFTNVNKFLKKTTKRSPSVLIVQTIGSIFNRHERFRKNIFAYTKNPKNRNL